jgi:RibD C-terminal domain
MRFHSLSPFVLGGDGHHATSGSVIRASRFLIGLVTVGHTRLVDQDPVEAVRSMREAGAPPLRTIGSLTLCRSLLEAGLVDRFRVVLFPVITGSTGQERIYDGYPDVGLEMVASRTFDGRLQLLEYVPTVLTGPPSGGQLT